MSQVQKNHYRVQKYTWEKKRKEKKKVYKRKEAWIEKMFRLFSA